MLFSFPLIYQLILSNTAYGKIISKSWENRTRIMQKNNPKNDPQIYIFASLIGLINYKDNFEITSTKALLYFFSSSCFSNLWLIIYIYRHSSHMITILKFNRNTSTTCFRFIIFAVVPKNIWIAAIKMSSHSTPKLAHQAPRVECD